MLENPLTGERQGFSNLNALTTFLKTSMDTGTDRLNLDEFDDGKPEA